MRITKLVFISMTAAAILFCATSRVAVVIKGTPRAQIDAKGAQNAVLQSDGGPPQQTKSSRNVPQPISDDTASGNTSFVPDIVVAPADMTRNSSPPFKVMFVLKGPTTIADALNEQGLDQQTVAEVSGVLGNVFPAQTIQSGTKLDFLLQPGEPAQLLQLVIIAPNGKAVAGVALTDRGEYVMSLTLATTFDPVSSSGQG